MKRRDTDPFEVSVYKTGNMNVLQTLDRAVQLPSQFSEGSGGKVSGCVQVPTCWRDSC